jgi:Leucine-rich repeat (LRR) protein
VFIAYVGFCRLSFNWLTFVQQCFTRTEEWILSIPTQITTLHIAGWRVDGSAMSMSSILCNQMYKMSLVSLSLNSIALRDDGALCVSRILSSLSGLNILCLNNNDISHNGAVHIADNLRHLPLLRVFEMGNNPLTAAGASVIIPKISRINSLENLCLIGARIGRTPSVYLRDLARLTQLKVLDLSINFNAMVSLIDSCISFLSFVVWYVY